MSQKKKQKITSKKHLKEKEDYLKKLKSKEPPKRENNKQKKWNRKSLKSNSQFVLFDKKSGNRR